MTTIKLKNGSGAPATSDLVQGEPALDLTNKRLYTENASGAIIEIGTSPSTIDINAGTIDRTVIGGSTAAAGTFTTFTSTGIDDNATSTKLTVADTSITTGSIDQFIVAHSTDGGGIRIDSTNSTNTGSLRFGDDLDNYIGALEYNHTSNAMSMYVNNETRMTIDSSGNVGIGSASNHAGARVVINDTPPTAFGSPMFQVGQETFTGSGMYSIGFGYTAGSYTEPPVEIAALTTSDSGGTKADIVFGTRSVTTNTAVTERMRIDSSGNVLVGKPSSGLTTAGSQITGASILQSVSSTSTNLATNNGAAINLCNTSATDGNFSNIGGYNSNGLVVSQINFINPSHSSRTGAITFTTHSGSAFSEAMRIDSSANVNIGSASNHAGARVVINDTPPTAFGSPMFQVGQETFTGSGMYSIGLGYTAGSYTEPPVEIAALTTSDSGGTKADIVFGTRSVTTNTAVTERMRIDSSGQVIILGNNGSPTNSLDLSYNGSTGEAKIQADSNGGSTFLTFGTSASGTVAESMRIDSSGNLLVGCTSFGSVSTEGCQLGNSGTAIFSNDSDVPLYLNRTTSGVTTSQVVVSFFRNDVQSGTIGVSQGGTPAFGAPSDIRLKNNVTDHKSELTNVMALRPVSWDWKDSSKGAGEGFVAQELEQTAWADLVSEGEDGYKMVSGLGAVETRLIKALQEAVTRIETLEAEVAALKGA